MTKHNPYTFKRDNTGEKIACRNEAYWKEIGKKKYELLLKRSDIPKFYWNIEFKDYKGELSKESLKRAIKFSQKCFTPEFDYVNLYLWSEENSSQKTAVACNVGKELLKQGKSVSFLYFGTLIDMLLKQSGFNYHEDIAFKLNKLKNVDILIIDDVFDTKKSIQWSNSDLIISEIDRFFREVLTSDLKVIMTSNIPIINIKKKYGVSLFELISRNFYPLQFNDSIKKYRKKMFENIFDEEK